MRLAAVPSASSPARPSAMDGAALDLRPARTVLRTRDLAVGYRTRRGGRVVLEGIDLAAEAGELICLLGRNGSGKSSLLRTLARLQPALSGTAELGGADVHAFTNAEMSGLVGVVLTERVTVDALAARQIVELGRYSQSGWFGRLDAADHRAVDWAIEAVGMQHLAARDFNQLSDGERQRVMIARALAQEPMLLLLDEPTAFLDAPSRVELLSLLRQLTRDRGLAVIVATHEIELALRTADVVWLITPDGEVVTGAPEDVIASGTIARTFAGPQIRFDDATRGFHRHRGSRGMAVVSGTGLRVAMARAVLEREDFAVGEPSAGRSAPGPALSIDVDGSGWRVRADNSEWNGVDFAAMARLLRRWRVEA
jgi:iron complex transport system ATP-binding protein